jgi:ABC-type branched-subunit amino acid transport system permease subunit
MPCATTPSAWSSLATTPSACATFAFIIAGFFAGIGGGLAAINFEIVTGADSVNVLRSGGYLLFTFLGGATFFFRAHHRRRAAGVCVGAAV